MALPKKWHLLAMSSTVWRPPPTLRPTLARPQRSAREWLGLEGVTRNNLRDLVARFPLGCFTVVTGVSGSGKSSLVSQALVDLVAAHLGHETQDEDEERADPRAGVHRHNLVMTRDSSAFAGRNDGKSRFVGCAEQFLRLRPAAAMA